MRLAAVFFFSAQIVAAQNAPVQPRSLPNQQALAPPVPVRAATTPPSGDTVGYWQQRADYQIVATLDERLGVLTATGSLRYVNRSPEVLRELWVHQHLNAFRPGSKWSATDEREGRMRFQELRDPDYAYERFTTPPRRRRRR